MRNQVINRLFQHGVFDQVAKWNRKKVAIVQYHGVTASTGPFQGIENHKGKHLAAAKFFDQMQYLCTHYKVMPLQEIVSHYVAKIPLPDCCAAITFDDGYRNNYSVAYPILRAFNLPATIFVTTEFVAGNHPLWVDRIEYALNNTAKGFLELDLPEERVALSLKNDREKLRAQGYLNALLKRSSQGLRSMVISQLEAKAERALSGRCDDQGDYASLTWDEVVEMQSSGLITIGSHTVTHPILPKCSVAEVEHELTLSKTLIEKILGRACGLFCYPNGDFDAGTRAAVGTAGYAGAASSMRGLNDNRADLLALKRFGVPNRFSLVEFAARVSGGLLLLSRIKSMVIPPMRRSEK